MLLTLRVIRPIDDNVRVCIHSALKNFQTFFYYIYMHVKHFRYLLSLSTLLRPCTAIAKSTLDLTSV